MSWLRHSALTVLLLANPAVADDEVPTAVDPPAPALPKPVELDPAAVARLRELYVKKDFVAVRRELLIAHAKTKDPQWLFALGQVELQLQRYDQAIEFYEQFIAAKPPQDQIELAQQAIGAARIQLANQKPRRHRTWKLADTLLVVGGGLAIGGGAGLFGYGHHTSLDKSGTLTDYEKRVDRARTMQITGASVASLGVVVAAFTLVRWRLRPEDGYEVALTDRGAAVSWRW